VGDLIGPDGSVGGEIDGLGVNVRLGRDGDISIAPVDDGRDEPGPPPREERRVEEEEEPEL
jgi:penicillin-binding protein 1A